MALVRRTLEEIKERAARRRPKLEPWSDEKIKKAAASDPNTWLPTEAELERFKPWRERAKSNVKELSEKDRKFESKE